MFDEIIKEYEIENVTRVKVYYNTVYIKSFFIRLDNLMDFCKDIKKLMKRNDIVEIQSVSGETITMEVTDE